MSPTLRQISRCGVLERFLWSGGPPLAKYVQVLVDLYGDSSTCTMLSIACKSLSSTWQYFWGGWTPRGGYPPAGVPPAYNLAKRGSRWHIQVEQMVLCATKL